MDGVIGEAEKEGRGDEVRARIEEFKKQSKLKGLATVSIKLHEKFCMKLSSTDLLNFSISFDSPIYR